ncbi:MAG: hypothetical protein KH355_03075 [Clostridiales bacterium]|nr:hypothetical protein [Clostridiales bacterium]
MVNLKPVIAKALKEVKGVKNICQEYPDDFSSMPTITYKENENSDTGNTIKEVISSFEYQVDIWKKGSTFDLAVQVDEKLSRMGFLRVSSNELVDPGTGLNHRILRFRGKYDAIHERICQ